MAADRKPGIKLDAVAHAHFDGAPSSLRFSTYLRELRKTGSTAEALAEFESDKAKYGSHCPTHGHLEDPIIGLVGESAAARVAFACPWCSGTETLAAWEKEGMRS